MKREGPLRIAMFSFGDIENYGDILFAHVFNMEMRKRLVDAEVHFYAPTEVVLDGIHYRAYTRERVDGRYDALVLAGGETVHFFDDRTWRPVYDKLNRSVASGTPSDIVWDWVECEASFKAWLSVGVRPFEDQRDERKLAAALNNLDRISVRGSLSKKILEDGIWNSYDQRIVMDPDLGWLFPAFLDHMGERGRHHATLTGGVREYVIYQVNSIAAEEAMTISDQLRRFQDDHGTKVFLLPVIRPWEDSKYLRLIEQCSQGELTLLDDKLGVVELADVIVHAQAVLCSSLHTAITALAAAVPAGIVNKWQGTKLQDLFGHQFRSDRLTNDLAEVYPMLQRLWEERSRADVLEAYAAFMRLALGRTFDDLAVRMVNAAGS